ncbi:MAG TPA: hypothetical protein VK745_03070 [Polyangiaceae bacterium]|jgi:hypothetical protein|nr:hypothetical protein [Polyangiaceae bacterium]
MTIQPTSAELNEESFDAEGRVEWVQEGADHELWVQLGGLAADALSKEDVALREALRNSIAASQYKECAAGLTYWLFETTLVFVVFKAWAPHRYVEWDCTGPTNRVTRQKNPIDLVVKEQSGRELGIEAKWWNSQRVELSLDTDANKLLNWIDEGAEGKRAAFLLAFWWTTEASLLHNQKEALEWCKRKGRQLVYRSSFPTRGPQDERRRFFLDVMAVPAMSDRSVRYDHPSNAATR